MNITSDTIAILKNFSDINQNILVKPGNQLQTISTLKNILAQADVSEKFEQEFAIYDLPEFLRAVDLFDKSDLAFNGGQNLTINNKNNEFTKKKKLDKRKKDFGLIYYCNAFLSYLCKCMDRTN